MESQGYSFGTPEDDELVPLTRLARDEFNPDWARVIREGVLGGLGLDRIIVAREPKGTIVGWAMSLIKASSSDSDRSECYPSTAVKA